MDICCCKTSAPHHLNQFYNNLSEKGIRQIEDRAIGRPEFRELLKEKKLSMAKIAKLTGIAESTVNQAGKGQPILREKVEAIAAAAQIDFDKLFTIQENNEPLSNTSINAYHRFIHIVLAQAEKEMLVPYNAAAKATPPPKEKSAVDTFQTAELIAIRDAAAKEPIKWQMAIHLLMITGCRRGEIVGLKWDRVNWEDSSIRIETTLNYTPERAYTRTPLKPERDAPSDCRRKPWNYCGGIRPGRRRQGWIAATAGRIHLLYSPVNTADTWHRIPSAAT